MADEIEKLKNKLSSQIQMNVEQERKIDRLLKEQENLHFDLTLANNMIQGFKEIFRLELEREKRG